VLAVYVLAASLFASPRAGLVSAVVLASFQGYAVDAPGGPDAKTPGILFAVTAMALLVKRRYFWGGFAGALAFLVWQPLLIYAVLAMLVAALTSPPGERARGSSVALLGAAIPVVATAMYFLAAGASRARTRCGSSGRASRSATTRTAATSPAASSPLWSIPLR
jgi:hypothetical protein